MLPTIISADLRFYPSAKTAAGREVATANALSSVYQFFKKKGFKVAGWLIDGKKPVSPSSVPVNPHKHHLGRLLPSGLVVLTRAQLEENKLYFAVARERVKALKKVNNNRNPNGVILWKDGMRIVFNYVESEIGVEKTFELTVNGIKKSPTYLNRLYAKNRAAGIFQTA